VSWVAPESSGTYRITHYWVDASPGSQGCLAVAPALTCTVTGLANGTDYTFTVEALNGAGWSPQSDPSDVVTPPGDTTIEIEGERGQVRGKRGFIVTGETTGLDPGTILRPYFKFQGMTEYEQGVKRIVVQEDGSLRWQRRGNKKVYAILRVESDTTIRSNRVIIKPAPKPTR
jgi:hypothetical protein